MEAFDVYRILSYGAIGLGFILAFLAFQLLRKEQDKERPRRQMLTSVYLFMLFSLALSAIGFLTEFATNSEIAELTRRLEGKEQQSREVAESLSVILEQKEIAALEQGGTEEIRRQIEMLKRSVARLSGDG